MYPGSQPDDRAFRASLPTCGHGRSSDAHMAGRALAAYLEAAPRVADSSAAGAATFMIHLEGV